ncbi:tetratricopeptide repeat protein [Ancylomarina salipaludis]|uniref:Tetratricopeptide repeat protein n=1 Tax=Ancylomarina salipaludis TaxID=2501299 RepID=A0A4Q1JNC2_9BACT|nr:tetratricopeptide repeat protein [Ancylomarina salipaludis]RXQ95560.1 tetratricopeptide repeat protein [Ancylomarina salipaludis]
MNKIITLLTLIIISFASIKAQNVERYKDYHDKGRMLILEGKYQEAIAQLDTAIQIMPYYARIFQDRGYAYMQLKNYELAVRDFDHVLKKQPYLNEVKLQRGMALYHLNYIDDAEKDLISVQEARPDKNYEAEYYLNNIYKEKELLRHQEQEKINKLRYQAESCRLERARHREDIIWNTVVPLAFWTTLFLSW